MQTSTMGKAVKAALVDGGECAAAAAPAAAVTIAPLPFVGVLALLCYAPACQARQPGLTLKPWGLPLQARLWWLA